MFRLRQKSRNLDQILEKMKLFQLHVAFYWYWSHLRNSPFQAKTGLILFGIGVVIKHGP